MLQRSFDAGENFYSSRIVIQISLFINIVIVITNAQVLTHPPNRAAVSAAKATPSPLEESEHSIICANLSHFSPLCMVLKMSSEAIERVLCQPFLVPRPHALHQFRKLIFKLIIMQQHDLISYWDNFVHQFSSIQQNPAIFGYTLLNLLRVEKADVILDAGCGPGLLIPEMIQRKHSMAKLISVDISSNMIQHVQKMILDYFGAKSDAFYNHINWEAYTADVEDLNRIAENTVDIYYSNMVFHLIGNPAKGLREAYRVLRPGGQLAFAVWGRREHSDQFTIWKETLLETGYEAPQGHDAFKFGEDKERVTKLLEEIGFSVQFAWYQRCPYDRFTAEEYLAGQNPKKLEVLDSKPDLKESFKRRLNAKIQQKLAEQQEPLYSECLLILARKEAH